jgi:phenylpyruvate tautomerase PptA (4-oxalocrotonate tautomerase family)
MPLHRLFVPRKLYSADDKSAIAEAITKVYVSLPPFYVVVLFVDIDKEDYYVGGQRRDDFVRIAVQHIARRFSESVILGLLNRGFWIDAYFRLQ